MNAVLSYHILRLLFYSVAAAAVLSVLNWIDIFLSIVIGGGMLPI